LYKPRIPLARISSMAMDVAETLGATAAAPPAITKRKKVRSCLI
jgi:hypothetical protein